MQAARKRGARIRDSFVGDPTSASPYPTRFTQLLRRVTEVHYPGVPFGPVPIWGAYTTSAIFRNRGFVAYGYSPIPMNIIDQSRMHANDERIFLRDFVNGVRLYADVIEEWALAPGEDQKKSAAAGLQ